MAQPINCDECHEREADFLLTDLANGETKGYCAMDFAVVAAGIAIAAIPAEALLEMIGPVHVVKAAETMKEAQAAKPRKRGKAPAEEPASGPEAAEEVAEEPPAAADGGA